MFQFLLQTRLLLAVLIHVAGMAPAFAEFPRMLPVTEPSSRKVVVVDYDGSDRSINLAVRSLQGLVNRHTPSVWVGQEDTIGRSGWWFDRLVAYGLVDRPTSTLTPTQFLQAYKSYAQGIVIPPSDLGPEAYHVAVARAAVDDLIVGTDAYASLLGLPIVEDYRGQFTSLAETYQYIYNQFIVTNKLNLTAFIHQRGDLASDVKNVDYAIQHKLFTYCWHEENYPELWALEDILNYMPDNIPMLGAVGGGPGYSNEGETIILISRYGKFSLGSSSADNLSFHTGLPRPTRDNLRQNLRTPPVYDPNKIYVCVQISDGDNTNTWRYHLLSQGHWQKRGQVPIGWSMASGLTELLPTAARYYYEGATPNDEFFQAISGLGYTFPGEFALGARDHGPAYSAERKEAAWNDFLYRAGAYMDYMDLQVSSTHHFKNYGSGLTGNEEWIRYAAQLPGCWGILNGYNVVWNLYNEKDRIVNGMPVLHTIINRNSGTAGQLKADIAAAAGTARPAFVQIFWVPFGLDFNWGMNELTTLPADTEVVLPSEFAAFYRQSHGLPTPNPWPIWMTPTPSPTGAPTVTPQPTPTSTPNLQPITLVNPGFELGNLTGWTRHYNDLNTYVTRTEFSISPFEGRWMFGGTHSFSGAGTRELIYQQVTVNPGDYLMLSAYLRTRTIGGPEESNTARLAYDPAGGTAFQYTNPYSGNNWRQESIIFQAENSTVTVGVELYQSRNLEWNHYFCDIFTLNRLIDVPTPTPAPPASTNLQLY